MVKINSAVDLKAVYDGFNLHDYIEITRILPSTPIISRTFNQNGRVDGSTYKYRKLQPATCVIEGFIRKDVMAARDILNTILYSPTEPKPLIINDQEDRQLMCLLNGQIKPSSRFINSAITLEFISEKPYWESTKPIKEYSFNSGSVEINNEGTYRTYPQFEVEFTSECGYIALVSPWGYMGIGNVNELDGVTVPPTENLITQRPFRKSAWSRVSDAENIFKDYIKLTSSGEGSDTSSGGLTLTQSSAGNTADRWNGCAYVKNFEKGAVQVQADNYRVNASIQFMDKSGNTSHTGAIMIAVLDVNDNPIMTTSVYNVNGDNNRVSTSFKINTAKQTGTAGNAPLYRESKIVHTETINALNGFIMMEKIGNRLKFLIHTEGTSGTNQALFKVGDTTYIKASARYGYDHNGGMHTVKDFTRGRKYTITDIRNFGGTTRYLISYSGVQVYWMNGEDIQSNQTNFLDQKSQDIRFEIDSSFAGQQDPYKVAVWMAKWGAGSPFDSMVVQSIFGIRMYLTDTLDIKNLFQPGDKLLINNETKEILLNGSVYNGKVDSLSRPFYIDYGKSTLGITQSDWARPPKAKISFKERFI